MDSGRLKVVGNKQEPCADSVQPEWKVMHDASRGVPVTMDAAWMPT